MYYVLFEHFISITVLLLGFPLLSSVLYSMDSPGCWKHSSQILVHCKSHILPHPKDALLDSDPVTGKSL